MPVRITTVAVAISALSVSALTVPGRAHRHRTPRSATTSTIPAAFVPPTGRRPRRTIAHGRKTAEPLSLSASLSDDDEDDDGALVVDPDGSGKKTGRRTLLPATKRRTGRSKSNDKSVAFTADIDDGTKKEKGSPHPEKRRPRKRKEGPPKKKEGRRRTTKNNNKNNNNIDSTAAVEGGRSSSGAPDDAIVAHHNYCIQFSRAFQRHVVYRYRDDDDDDDDDPDDDLHHRRDNGKEAVRSFAFLDEAVGAYPGARVLAPSDLPFPPPSCALVYPDEDASVNGEDEEGGRRLVVSRGRLIDTDVEEEECETTVAGMGLWTMCDLEYPAESSSSSALDEEGTETGGTGGGSNRSHEALRTLLALVSPSSESNGGGGFDFVPRHFFRLDPRRFDARGTTPEGIASNHARVADLLSRGGSDASTGGGGGDDDAISAVGLAMDPSDVQFVLQNFPQLCLYDCGELEGLIRFMTQPLPPVGSVPVAAGGGGGDGSSVDWPILSGKGYGADLTVEQATKVIRMMPELLALYYEDARKPSMAYVYNQMSTRVPPKLIAEANRELNLEGADAADACAFGYLRSLGASWDQIRTLSLALPLWTTCSLEPGWELMQRGPVRSALKRPALDCLRGRLQAGPGDVHRMLKTHTRLSTYDACKNIVPKLDAFQGRLGLSSAELRKLMMRMPSLMGMGISSFEDRVDFFVNEADMSIGDLRGAVLKQPSLIQYSVNSTLRPKLDFLLYELGISESFFISSMIKSAPALMGLSLTSNLRPKVVSIMRSCDLGPHEVGYVLSTDPRTLLLSQKNKIEPTLKFLAQTLSLSEPRELGELLLNVPRVLRQGLATSLAKKMDMLAEGCDGSTERTSRKDAAVAIVRKNPALLVASNAVLEDRIRRCPEDVDLATWLLPSNRGRGRRRNDVRPIATEVVGGDPVLASPEEDGGSFGSLTGIYPNAEVAARELGIAEEAVREACEGRIPVGGNYLCSLADYPSASPSKPPKAEAPGRAKIIPVSIFCSGGIHPRDNVGVARGQSRTGGLAIQVFTDASHDRIQFLREFSIAAKSCFGIRVPISSDDGGSKLLAVFPLVNPSRNRCELFACSGALRILEALLKTKAKDGGTLYDVKVYTDANSYTWNLVKSKERLLELGSYFTSRDADDIVGSRSVNIDILLPLARTFSCLNNGHKEPAESPHQTLDNAKVEFVHSMDGVSLDQLGLGYVKGLKRQATSAATWQFNRERNLV